MVSWKALTYSVYASRAGMITPTYERRFRLRSLKQNITGVLRTRPSLPWRSTDFRLEEHPRRWVGLSPSQTQKNAVALHAPISTDLVEP